MKEPVYSLNKFFAYDLLQLFKAHLLPCQQDIDGYVSVLLLI